MSHGHSHQTEANPSSVSKSALFFGIIIASLAICLIGFVQAMSGGHGEEHGHDAHATEHVADQHDNHGHTWEKQSHPEDYSTVALTGGKTEPVVNVDNHTIQSTENTKAPEGETLQQDPISVEGAKQDASAIHK